MDVTCGVMIINEFNELFVAHSTGNKFFDLPKGMKDEGETPLQAVIRECDEETSIVLKPDDLLDLGQFNYNSKKHLHLFLTKVTKDSIKLDELVCRSMFEHPLSKRMLPEADGFKWIEISKESIQANCTKSMFKVLSNYFDFK